MIIGIYGRLGSGKTALMVYLIKHYYNEGYTVYTNLENIKIPVKKFDPLDFYVKRNVANKTLVAIDELYLWADCRRSSSWQNLILTYLILQSRKFKFDFIYTEQLKHLADLRIVEFTDMWIKVKKIDDRYSMLFVIDEEGNISKVLFDRSKVYDLYDTYEIVMPLTYSAKEVKKRLKQLTEKYKKDEK